MNWIFPMGGKGTRTSKLGDFKPFIYIKGRRMFEWFMISIMKNIGREDKLYFISTQQYNEDHNFIIVVENVLNRLGIFNAREFILTQGTTKGPADTVYRSKGIVSPYESVTVINCDQWIDFTMEPVPSESILLPVYVNLGNMSSYIKFGSKGMERIVEKIHISNVASAGVYTVSSAQALFYGIKEHMKNDEAKEYFVGPSLNYLLEKGYTGIPIEIRSKYNLGSLKGIKDFETLIDNMKKGI